MRQDAYAKAHPLIVEEEKPERERGHNVHPELHGAGEELSTGEARHPGHVKEMQESKARREQMTAAARAAGKRVAQEYEQEEARARAEREETQRTTFCVYCKLPIYRGAAPQCSVTA